MHRNCFGTNRGRIHSTPIVLQSQQFQFSLTVVQSASCTVWWLISVSYFSFLSLPKYTMGCCYNGSVANNGSTTNVTVEVPHRSYMFLARDINGTFVSCGSCRFNRWSWKVFSNRCFTLVNCFFVKEYITRSKYNKYYSHNVAWATRAMKTRTLYILELTERGMDLQMLYLTYI